MFFNNGNIFFIILAQAVANIFYLSVTASTVQSLPVESTKQKSKEIQNKQSPKVGKFQLVYDSNTQYKDYEQYFQQTKVFEKVVNDLNNHNLNLPVDIPIIFGDCGSENAFYSPSEQIIGMCYELFDSITELFASPSATEADIINNTMLTWIFILYHEAGHALTDILDLAVTGKEEDAVDDFASILLLNSDNPNADKIILNSSVFFLDTEDGPYWDEHSFGKQRYYNIVCLLYGKDPQKYAYIPAQVGLGGRTDRCPNEYKQKSSSWSRLLAPHSVYDTTAPAQVPDESSDTPQPLF